MRCPVSEIGVGSGLRTDRRLFGVSRISLCGGGLRSAGPEAPLYLCRLVEMLVCMVAVFAAAEWLSLPAVADESESDYYQLLPYPIPENLKLEASGLATLPDGRLAVAIRKGEIWILENPLLPKPDASADDYVWKRFASGLHEPLGLTWHDGALYTTQRSEVTRIEDNDKDGIADAYLTAAKGWGVTGNYHEYAYGPVFDSDGTLWITLNINIGKPQDLGIPGQGENTRWRGWSMRRKAAAGSALEPVSAGMRSPMGLAVNAAGDVFCSDQQGNYWATNPINHIREGVFHGHADSLRDVDRPESPVKNPGEVPKQLPVPEAMKLIPGYAPPAVWFPYEKVGMSTTGLLFDTTRGGFGPFQGQMFVGEFTMAFVSRVFLEKVNGEYQGACFHFRKGMQTAVLQMEWLPDGSMVVGESNRGWNSLGDRSFGLERLIWTGKTPFEIRTMEAQPDGFVLRFTRVADPKTAADPKSYQLTSYTYEYHQAYGGEEIMSKAVAISAAEVADDGMSVRLRVAKDKLREGFVHELHAEGVRDSGGAALLHPQAYYTLNAIPTERGGSR